MTVEYSLREYDEADYDAMVVIRRAIEPYAFTSVVGMREWDEIQRAAGRLSVRWEARMNGALVGFGYVGEVGSLPPDVRWIYLAVHPDNQGLGIGRTLLERCEGTGRDNGGTAFMSGAPETLPRLIEFLEAAGYVEIDRAWRSTLDLSTFQIGDWSGTLREVDEAGITILSAGELRDSDPEWDRKLYDLYVALERDIPFALDLRDVSFEDFTKLTLESDHALLDGFLVALDGHDYVGLTQPTRVENVNDAVAQELTGTRRSHRGRGIAIALKARSAAWAQDRGYQSIRTYNSESNGPMLAVNSKLGFTREHGHVELLKKLEQ